LRGLAISSGNRQLLSPAASEIALALILRDDGVEVGIGVQAEALRAFALEVRRPAADDSFDAGVKLEVHTC